MKKKLSDYTPEEWEAVCNQCGKCCLIKLQDEDTDDIYYTDVVCQYMDPETCRCTHYQDRCQLVPTCLKLTPQNVDKIEWMPPSCAYRALVENRPRPLRKAVSGRCISETKVKEDELEDHIIDWPDL